MGELITDHNKLGNLIITLMEQADDGAILWQDTYKRYKTVSAIENDEERGKETGKILGEIAALGIAGKITGKSAAIIENKIPELLQNERGAIQLGEGASKAVSINPNEIRFSQSSVNGAEEIIQSMKANGWKGDPIDVIKMSDDKLTTIDNTRVVAAREAGIEVKANIHDANEPLPKELVERFTTKKGVPTTWGEAIELRIGKQNASFRNDNPLGADTMEKVGK